MHLLFSTLLSVRSGDNFNRTISLQFTGRAGDTSTVTWLRDGDLLQPSPTAAGYMITTGYSGNTEGSTSLVFTEDFLSRSLEGRYTVTVENNNDVIPEQDRRENFSFQVTVTGEQMCPHPSSLVVENLALIHLYLYACSATAVGSTATSETGEHIQH